MLGLSAAVLSTRLAIVYHKTKNLKSTMHYIIDSLVTLAN